MSTLFVDDPGGADYFRLSPGLVGLHRTDYSL
jgi:hypothetical protein